MRKLKPLLIPALLILLEIIYFFIRWFMAQSPLLAESYYDEAVTGNMALHILRGDPQLFFWGQPYMGALEAYLISFLFHLFGPSAFTLHLTDILICAFLLFLVNRIGTLVGGRLIGILAAAYWAISPLYLTVVGLLATGGHVEACALGTFCLLGIWRLVFTPSKELTALAFLVGLIAGLGWWSSLLVSPFLAAGVIVLIGARPGLLLSRIPWCGLAGFSLGSLPFWQWQILHGFSTFHFFEATGGGIFNQIFSRIYTVLRLSLFQSFLGDWWDGHSVLPSVPSFLAWTVFILIYLPAFALSLLVIFQWVRRIIAFRNPFQEPKDMVVATFWIFVLVFSASEQGAAGSLRYTLSLYVPFTVLVAFWLGKIFKIKKALGATILAGLLAFNLFLHFLFLDEFKNLPYRPVDQLIKALKDHGIRYAYADNRISQVLTFESREEIICADFYGQRNFNYLRAVDAAPAEEVAIVTDRRLGNPNPKTMSAVLRLLGGSNESVEVGPYVFWHHFKEPSENLSPLSPQDWKITASQENTQGPLIKDRDILTSWKILKRAGDYLSVDLGRPKQLVRISLLPGPIGFGLPSGLKLEFSLNQKKWEEIAAVSVNDMLGGLYWAQGHPRFDQNPRLQFSFAPRLARYIRFTNLATPQDPEEPWSIAELFIYQISERPFRPSEKALEAYDQAGRTLDHWMDDPTGPHPLFPGASSEARRKQVDWQTVVHFSQKAIQEAPDWEEVHQLFGHVVDWGEMWKIGIKPKKLSFYDTLFSKKELNKIVTNGFKVSSNMNNAETSLAIDGNPFTRWTSLKWQEPGMFFQVNLGSAHLVNSFSILLGSSLNDYPRSLQVLSSLDGNNWQEIRTASHSDYAFSQNRLFKKVHYQLGPIKTQFLRLVETGKDPGYWWSIYELEVFGNKW